MKVPTRALSFAIYNIYCADACILLNYLSFCKKLSEQLVDLRILPGQEKLGVIEPFRFCPSFKKRNNVAFLVFLNTKSLLNLFAAILSIFKINQFALLR
jgi:hypothetical protein